MKHVTAFFAALVLTTFAFMPTAAFADGDALEDLDVTMIVLDNPSDLEVEMSRMDGPDDDGVSDEDWSDEEEERDVHIGGGPAETAGSGAHKVRPGRQVAQARRRPRQDATLASRTSPPPGAGSVRVSSAGAASPPGRRPSRWARSPFRHRPWRSRRRL